MKHFYVITNNQKDPDRTTTKKIRTYLEKRGCTCEVQEQSEQGDIRTDAAKIPGETQGILVLGGDGTILQASRDTVEREIPVIGVNLGTLGYLAEIEQNRLEEALERLIQDDYELEKRMMLRGTIAGNEIDALNDIVISRKGSLRIIAYKVYVNNKKIDEPYIKSRMVKNDYKEIKVQEGYVFVLGDNRNNSLDSRYESVGLVNVDEQVSGIVKMNLTKIFKSNTVVKAFALFLIFLFAVVVDIILNIKPKKGEDGNVSGIEDRRREDNNP